MEGHARLKIGIARTEETIQGPSENESKGALWFSLQRAAGIKARRHESAVNGESAVRERGWSEEGYGVANGSSRLRWKGERMTKTQAIREVMESATIPLSLREIQLHVETKCGRYITDGTVSRRLREAGAACKRDRSGVFRYWLPSEQKGLSQ